MADFISIDDIKNIIISCNIDLSLFKETKWNLEFKYKYGAIYLHKTGLVEYMNKFDYYNEERDFQLFKNTFEKLKTRMIYYDDNYGYLNNGNLLESQVNMLMIENEKLKNEIYNLRRKFNF